MSDPTGLIQKSRTAPQWKKIGIRPHHGICLPLSALRTKNGCGIGDFGDLFPLVDWCRQVGFDCIQLLPLNDSGDDPSPYNALSSCALDPVYINLADLPGAETLDLSPYAPLNALPRIDYSAVKKQKLASLRQHFEKTSPDPLYNAFLADNPWLPLYALFKVCKQEEEGAGWQDWPREKQSPATCPIADPREIDFICFLQFHAFRQLERVKQYAEENGVFIKGDIPILLSPDSADVWANPEIFDLNYAAGAPPDMYNALGQKWGFPLFRWNEIRKTNYAWWKQRLSVAERLFHIYRIDHVVGFFRIWAIRKNEKAMQGRYLPENHQVWEGQGREILEMMIDSSSMLPMAEDLGNIPPMVPIALRQLGICGTKVVRWQRRWHEDGGFIDPKTYEPISLTTISTPDSETLQIWWNKLPQEASLYAQFKHWTYEPELQQWQRREILREAHQSASLFHINILQEYLALFPELVSSNPDDERINLPGTVLPTNWTYRFKPTLEEIASHQGLAEAIRSFTTEIA